MVERLVTRFRALLGGRDQETEQGGEDGFDEAEPGVPGFDPEWEQLVAWARESEDDARESEDDARESEDDAEWTAVIARAKHEAAEEAGEWARLLARAKALSPGGKARPMPVPVPMPVPMPVRGSVTPPAPAGSISSLSARLERLAAQVPNARRSG